LKLRKLKAAQTIATIVSHLLRWNDITAVFWGN
jgi:hypothetical protein